MTLVIDSASAARRLNSDEFNTWARDRKIFVSSVMEEFEHERRELAAALRDLGMQPIIFEALGGQDDDAEAAFLAGVDQSDVYLGIIGDRYGTMQPGGRSATHAEYLRAKSRGKRISVWSKEPSPERQGNEVDFLTEVQLFQTTGRFDSSARLVAGVQSRIEEIAADDESPWVKLGECIFRGSRIRIAANQVTISATVRDTEVARRLLAFGPNEWGQPQQTFLTTSFNSGAARINEVAVENTSTSASAFEITAEVAWGTATGPPMMPGTGGYSAEDLVKIGIESGLLVANLPADLQNNFLGQMIDLSDPLCELLGLDIPEGAFGPIARLLVVERLVGGGFASHIDEFALGPPNTGVRQVRLVYTDAQRYSNAAPVKRTIEGERPWH